MGETGRRVAGSEPARIAVVAFTLSLTFQCVRALFPLVYLLGERTSFIRAGLMALVVFTAPLLTPLFIRTMGARCAVLMTAGLAVVRVVMQIRHPVGMTMAVAGVAVGLVALTAHLGASRPLPKERDACALGLLLGVALDTAVRSAFWTWDHVWQPGPGALLTSLLLGAGAVAVAWRTPATSTGRGYRLGALRPAALGPFLWLQTMFLNNPAFVASETGLSLPWATALILAGDTAALALVGSRHPPSTGTAGLTIGVASVVSALALGAVTGALSIVAIVTSIPLTALLLAGAFSVELHLEPGRAPWTPSLAMTAGTLGFAGLVFAYQIHYDQPLPISNNWLLPGAAALLAIGGCRRSSAPGGEPWARDRRRFVPALPCAALLLVPAVMTLSAPDPQRPGDDGDLSLVSYNVHSTVDAAGQLDPESIADVIESRRPDVVVLQEVNRGWAIAGAIDVAEWMSRRLDMPCVYSPAADGQFGNAIFTRLPVIRAETGSLPAAGGPQSRSFVMTELGVGGGDTMTAIGVHLQHRPQDTPARLKQIEMLLQAWGRTRRTIVAGDMNAGPGSVEIGRFRAAGLESAGAATGNQDVLTWPSHRPRKHIDWIFGTSDIAFDSFEVLRTTASDHLPLVVNISPVGD